MANLPLLPHLLIYQYDHVDMCFIYNIALLTLFLKLCPFWPLGTPSANSRGPRTHPAFVCSGLVFLSASLLSSCKCSRLVLCISGSSPRVSHFLKKLCLLPFARESSWKPRSGTDVFVAAVVLSLYPLADKAKKVRVPALHTRTLDTPVCRWAPRSSAPSPHRRPAASLIHGRSPLGRL